MKITIIKHNSPRGIRVRHRDVLVQDQFQCRIPVQVALHLNAPVDGGVYDVARGVEQYVYFLVTVYEDLVCFVLGDGYVGGCGRDGLVGEEWDVPQFFNID